MEALNVFVLHVKKGYEDRAVHMEKVLGKTNTPFEYMLDGDISDLTPERMERYFGGELSTPSPVSSCAMKHLLVAQKMVDEGIPEALVFEDDIFLKRRFWPVVQKSRKEMAPRREAGLPFWVGFEAGSLKVVARSQRRRGRVVYPGSEVQCAGAYLLNLPMARLIVESARAEKVSVPFDWYADSIRRRLPEAFYWSYPVVAEQGSHNGSMHSIIGHGQKSRMRKIKRKMTMCYKELVALFK